MCGPDPSDEYIDCFSENVTWVSGMSGGERRPAFKRGELNGTRENPSIQKACCKQQRCGSMVLIPGIPDAATGTHSDDPTIPQAI